MGKLYLKWLEHTVNLSIGQKIGLLFVMAMGVLIAIGFSVLIIVMASKGKLIVKSDENAQIKESLVLPKRARIQSVFSSEKDNVIFQIKYNRNEYLYYYEIGKKDPQHIVKIEYQ